MQCLHPFMGPKHESEGQEPGAGPSLGVMDRAEGGTGSPAVCTVPLPKIFSPIPEFPHVEEEPKLEPGNLVRPSLQTAFSKFLCFGQEVVPLHHAKQVGIRSHKLQIIWDWLDTRTKALSVPLSVPSAALGVPIAWGSSQQAPM